jgi:hypothetical protein
MSGVRCGARGLLSQRSTRAASELLPGPLGVPARSWLTDRQHHPEKLFDFSDKMMRQTHAGNGKRGPVPNRLRRRRK